MKTFLIFLSPLIFSAVEILSAQPITELKFPYRHGYTLNLKGTSTTFQSDGNKQTDSTFTLYFINEEKTIKGNTWVNFKCASIMTETNYFESYLSVNSDGMQYESAAPENRKKKYIVDAINLPLTDGKTWSTKLQGWKAECTCLSTHTFISTPKGDVEAFCVQTIALIEKLKGYDYKMKVLEFYNQEIGKVAYSSFFYYEKPSGEIYNLMEMHEVAYDYGFKETK